MKIEFELNYTKKLFVIMNTEESKVEMAFKVKECNIEEVLHLLYSGFDDEACSNSEEKLCVYLLKKQRYLFHESSKDEELTLFRMMRKYTEIYRKKLNPESKVSYFSSVRKVLSEGKLLNVSFALNRSLKGLEEKLKRNSLIKTDGTGNGVETEEFDLLITNSIDGIDAGKYYQNILFIGNQNDQIVIGPLVHSDKFEIPILEYKEMSGFLDSEIDLVAFFVERFLFVIITDLYDKAGSLPYLPNRYRLLLHRAELTMQTEEQILTPKYLRADPKT